jgi:hypothetical protein
MIPIDEINLEILKKTAPDDDVRTDPRKQKLGGVPSAN